MCLQAIVRCLDPFTIAGGRCTADADGGLRRPLSMLRSLEYRSGASVTASMVVRGHGSTVGSCPTACLQGKQNPEVVSQLNVGPVPSTPTLTQSSSSSQVGTQNPKVSAHSHDVVVPGGQAPEHSLGPLPSHAVAPGGSSSLLGSSTLEQMSSLQ